MTRETNIRFARIGSPLGELLLVGEVRHQAMALRGLYFAGARHARDVIEKLPGACEGRSDRAAFGAIVLQLEDYFAGKRTTFAIELAPHGTAFQKAVWEALASIPYGGTTTYAAIARAIGRPRAVRAVGAANARNPLSIVVPCHRVIGRDGSLTGYAGGVAQKAALLKLESRAASAVA